MCVCVHPDSAVAGALTKSPETKRLETKRPETKRPETKRPETKRPWTKRPSGSYLSGPCWAIFFSEKSIEHEGKIRLHCTLTLSLISAF